MRIETDSTICAIATGAEGALRGVIRISGPGLWDVLERLAPRVESPWKGLRTAQVVNTWVTTTSLGEIPVAMYVWPNHRSYTGQLSAELHLLGAPVVLREVQSELLRLGVRLAQPGEFTLRAFLAGRMDLTQCEAVLGLIHAEGEHAFQVALHQLAGGLASPLQALRQELIYLLADLEAGLDFVDEDIEFISPEQLLQRLESAAHRVAQLQRQLEHRGGQGGEYQVAVVGLPNAGKSSLVNAICDQAVSIISHLPGTTRDYVRCRVRIGEAVVDLLDTAGLESIDDATPRAMAQQFTNSALENADLILWCEAADVVGDPKSSVVSEPVQRSRAGTVWRVRTKIDLDSHEKGRGEPFSEALSSDASGATVPVGSSQFAVSVVDGRGVEALKQQISRAVQQHRERVQDVVPMTGERCRAALLRAAESLNAAVEAAQLRAGDEIVAGELRLALEDVGEVAGVVVNNDILDALFSRFCIGK